MAAPSYSQRPSPTRNRILPPNPFHLILRFLWVAPAVGKPAKPERLGHAVGVNPAQYFVDDMRTSRALRNSQLRNHLPSCGWRNHPKTRVPKGGTRGTRPNRLS